MNLDRSEADVLDCFLQQPEVEKLFFETLDFYGYEKDEHQEFLDGLLLKIGRSLRYHVKKKRKRTSI